jgi:competence protein ComEC
MTAKQIHTRFRAYSLGTEGGSYSIFIAGHFTLIEARVTEKSWKAIAHELDCCGKRYIDTLHITSWDLDHCKLRDLEWILDQLRPTRIEYPGYPPDKDEALACLQRILAYQREGLQEGTKITPVSITPAYIDALGVGEKLLYNDIFYHPRSLYENANDNSTVKLFRRGSFNVASLGDVEHDYIGAGLRRCPILCSETDLLILPHHGSDHSVLSRRFLKEMKPQLGVCSNDYDDKHGHPDESIREMFKEAGIPLLCTKTGDVLVESMAPHGVRFQGWNAHHDEIYRKGPYVAKKARLMLQNQDSLRDHYRPSSRPFIR